MNLDTTALAILLLMFAVALVQRHGRGYFLFAGPAMLWMIPLAYATIFAGRGTVLAAVALVSPRLVRSRPTFAGFAWLSVFGLLLPFVQLHPAETRNLRDTPEGQRELTRRRELLSAAAAR